jgi:hypothetical protein
MKKTKKRSMPVMTIPTLMTLSQSGSRLLICSGESFILTKRSPKYVSAKVYDALRSAGWISAPVARGEGIAESLLTPEGKSIAEKIKAQRNKYCQLLLL